MRLSHIVRCKDKVTLAGRFKFDVFPLVDIFSISLHETHTVVTVLQNSVCLLEQKE